jgi:hypothetical protein
MVMLLPTYCGYPMDLYSVLLLIIHQNQMRNSADMTSWFYSTTIKITTTTTTTAAAATVVANIHGES